MSRISSPYPSANHVAPPATKDEIEFRMRSPPTRSSNFVNFFIAEQCRNLRRRRLQFACTAPSRRHNYQLRRPLPRRLLGTALRRARRCTPRWTIACAVAKVKYASARKSGTRSASATPLRVCEDDDGNQSLASEIARDRPSSRALASMCNPIY